MTGLPQAIEAETANGSQAPPRAETPEQPVFARVYEEHFPFVWRSACRLGVDPSHLDDVVQETFVVVHRRLAQFAGRSSIKTWLFGILFNVARAHWRTLRAGPRRPAATSVHTDPDAMADASAGPHECAAREEAARLVTQLLGALGEDKRAVFVLAELEQMSAPDIALALGVPLNTVYSRLRLARQEFATAAARHRARDEWRTG